MIVGHFDMLGALMEAGQISEAGFDMDQFYHAAKLTFSGHYHCKSTNTNGDGTIYYVGSPYHLSFAHVKTDCGYYLVTGDAVEFVENTMSPRFIECVDTDLDDLPDMKNSFVRYFYQGDRRLDEMVDLKKKVEAKHPLHIKEIPYGANAGSIDEVRDADDEETRRIMSLDSFGMAELYMETNAAELPVLRSGADPKEKILEFLHQYDEKRK